MTFRVFENLERLYTYTLQLLNYLSIQYAGAMGDVNRIIYQM